METQTKQQKKKATVKAKPEEILDIKLSEIETGTLNPRNHISEKELLELSENIKLFGVLQPIIVRKKDSRYEIVCGERRYRAAVLAKRKTIPAIVKELSDVQALEIAVTENLQRENITPLEEANAYSLLVKNNNYDTASLAARFGKSEKYIYNRLRILALIPEIAELLNQSKITWAMALTICKYPNDIQEDLFVENLNDNTYNCNSWLKISNKEFSARMEKKYSSSLESFDFDKTDCHSCQHNENQYSLFENGKLGNCMYKPCLRGKMIDYALETIIEHVKSNPSTTIARVSWIKTNKLIEKLENEGYGIEAVNNYEYFPDEPDMPELQDYESQKGYKEDLQEYETGLKEYKEKLLEIENKIKEGKARKYIVIDNSQFRFGYVECEITETSNTPPPVENAEGEIKGITPKQVQAKEDIGKLEQQDKRNKEIADENTIDEIKKLILTKDLSNSEFTSLEEKILYFTLLPFVREKHFETLNVKGKHYLSDDNKLKIIETLSEAQKHLIARETILALLKNAYGNNAYAKVLMQFAKQHMPDETTAIEKKYQEVYSKRKTRLDEKITLLEKELEDKEK